MTLPIHLAIIMDGNGRWAEQRGLPRIAGHRQGVETARAIISACRARSIGYLTLFAFSSENWLRPPAEVTALMELLVTFLQQEAEELVRQGVRLRVIGEIDRLSPEARQVLDEACARTAQGEEMTLTLALSYGARDELVQAARHLAREVQQGALRVDDIDEQVFSGALSTTGLPDPDLLIRTSGEMRISNFLLWQLAYTELFFTPVLWPEFGSEHLDLALAAFRQRERRFGRTTAQLDAP